MKDAGGNSLDNSHAIFRAAGPGAPLEIFAREGDAAPGIAGNATYDVLFSAGALNDVGDFAYIGRLREGPGVDESNDVVLFGPRGGPGSVTGVRAREGDPAPGVHDNAEFSTVVGRPVMNSEADIAFLGTLRSSDNGGVVNNDNTAAVFGPSAGPNSELGLLARESFPIPGAIDGAVFGLRPELDSVDFTNPIMNDLGHVVFESFLRDGDGGDFVDDSNDKGLFAYFDSTLHLIAREGDAFTVELNDGTFEDRVIEYVDNLSYANDVPHTLNNDGELAFHLQFTDGTSGIFTTQLGVVPEPSGITLLLFGLTALLRWRIC